MSSLRTQMLLVGFACLLFAGCGRDVAEAIHNNSQELSGLRKAIQDLHQNPPAKAAPDRPQIDAALAPLREVMTQLTRSQASLASQQATLTKELQRWTQLLVQSTGNGSSDDARQLAERLTQLEATMRAQDERHREVEKLLQNALDHTADQLEDFLDRLSGSTQPGGDPAPAEEPPANPAESTGSPAGNGGDEERRGSMQWLWWLLIAGTLTAGAWLLFDARRRRPVSIAPEMRAAPPPGPELERAPAPIDPPATSLATGDNLPADGQHTVSQRNISQSAPEVDAEPEVEELWAAAALLGEAIGKLKQNGADPSELLEQQLRGHGEHVHPGEPPRNVEDLFVIADQVTPDSDPELDANVQPLADGDLELGPLVDDSPIVPGPQPIADEPPQEVPEPVCEIPRPEPRRTRQPDRGAIAKTTSAPAPISCWLPVRDSLVAEARVRALLGTDPRVLIAPAPEVHQAAGELHVTFAMLPGLPAGERSLLEQQLRDCVA